MLDMPFGKYKGVPIDEIPTSYLLWVWENADVIQQPRNKYLKAIIKRVLDDAGIFDYQEDSQPSSDIDISLQLKKWWRTMVKRYHPDVGGSHEAMTALQEAWIELKELLKPFLGGKNL